MPQQDDGHADGYVLGLITHGSMLLYKIIKITDSGGLCVNITLPK